MNNYKKKDVKDDYTNIKKRKNPKLFNQFRNPNFFNQFNVHKETKTVQEERGENTNLIKIVRSKACEISGKEKMMTQYDECVFL